MLLGIEGAEGQLIVYTPEESSEEMGTDDLFFSGM
jgi:hypothetical protein